MSKIMSDEIFILDDDPSLGDLLSFVLRSEGFRVSCFRDDRAFTAVARQRTPACIVLDVYMPRRSGLDVLKDLDAPAYGAPIIVMSGSATISLAVEAAKCGAFDVVEKPFEPRNFPARVRETIDAWMRREEKAGARPLPSRDFPGACRLTQREWTVLAEIVAASSNKEAAAHLGLSPRTVEVHRAHIMMKLGAKNTADLMRLVMAQKTALIESYNK